jgi:ketosteroid isomerase-like protein
MRTDADVVRDLLAAFARRDADAVAGLVARDGMFVPLSTEAATRGVYVGPAGVHAYLRDLSGTWQQFDLTVDAVEQVGGHVLATGRIYARARHTNLVADNPAAFAFAVRAGRMTWGQVFTTEAAARAAIDAREGE